MYDLLGSNHAVMYIGLMFDFGMKYEDEKKKLCYLFSMRNRFGNNFELLSLVGNIVIELLTYALHHLTC